jgi:quercetin dioxygenase-like cupin family protein
VHAAGVVHRDLKPSNLLRPVTARGHRAAENQARRNEPDGSFALRSSGGLANRRLPLRRRRQPPEVPLDRQERVQDGYIDQHNRQVGVKMSGLVRKSLDSPEEIRPFEGGTGQLELVNVEGGAVGRATFLPGWRWSEHVKPIAKTDSCQAAHMGYFVAGRMKVVMDDGEEMEFGPGDFAIMAPGHDAWTVGDEPCVVIDWQGFADYAKR